jgi:hypothetical protein
MELNGKSDRELLELYARVMRLLRDRNTISSSNNPVADVAEQLAAKAFGLTLAAKSEKGFDGIDLEGVRYQVKGRRLTPENKSTELSIVRNLEDGQFDYLLAIYFDEFWGIHRAIRMTHEAFARHASFSSHRNGHRFTLTAAVREDNECEDVTGVVSECWG